MEALINGYVMIAGSATLLFGFSVGHHMGKDHLAKSHPSARKLVDRYRKRHGGGGQT